MPEPAPIIAAVTGSTGYVGSLIANELAHRGQVYGLTRRPSAPNDIRWSFTDQANLAAELKARSVSVLIHAAWDLVLTRRADIWQNNVEGSLRLFEQARAAGVQRIVFISTISAFPGARSLYGQSKLEVEAAVAAQGGIILRPGLVTSTDGGGMFGSLRKQVRSAKLIPLIGNGMSPQYLVPGDFLGRTVADAATGRFDALAGHPITLANPHPWPFRALLESIARREGRSVKFLPIPWRALYAGLRTGELLGLKLPFRSDSVTSFIHQNPTPDRYAANELNITVPPYER